MSVQDLGDRQVEKIVKANPKKLVAIDFWSESCPPCRRMRPIWQSYPEKYPSVIFCASEVNRNQNDARQYDIRQIPTFLFFKNFECIEKVVGADPSKLEQIIEKHRTASLYEGSAHTLGDAPQTDYFTQLLQGAQPKVTSDPTPAKPVQKHTPPPPVDTSYFDKLLFKPDPETFQLLIDAGFSKEQANEALKETNNGDIDVCIEYLEKKQNDEEQKANDPAPEAPAPVPEQPPQKELQKPLTEAGIAMRNQLVEMGYEEEIVVKAIRAVGSDSIDRVIDAIERIQRGEDPTPPPPPPQRSREELEAAANELRARIAQKEEAKAKAQPKANANAELKRRQEVREQMEAKEKFEKMKAEQELRERAKEKARQKAEREKILAKINRQREENLNRGKPQPVVQEQPKPAPTAAPSKPSNGQVTLKLQGIPDQPPLIVKLPGDERFTTVDAKVRHSNASIAGRKIYYTCMFPRFQITPQDFNKNLVQLGLAPSAVLTVEIH